MTWEMVRVYDDGTEKFMAMNDYWSLEKLRANAKQVEGKVILRPVGKKEGDNGKA